MAALISGLIIGVTAGVVQDRWLGDEDQETSIAAGQFVAPDRFQGGVNINPGDFIDLANAEGGAPHSKALLVRSLAQGGRILISSVSDSVDSGCRSPKVRRPRKCSKCWQPPPNQSSRRPVSDMRLRNRVGDTIPAQYSAILTVRAHWANSTTCSNLSNRR